MKLSLKSFLMIAALTAVCVAPALAEEPSQDKTDKVTFTLSTEGWVTTKTARVTLNVEAAVSGNAAGNMRSNMTKAVDEVAKAEWRLVRFNRAQDQTGMERWSASFEARVPENELNGLNEDAKKVSKAGMQITVGSIEFTPTLEETQATQASLRTEIYKKAVEQLGVLNASIPGRAYRIADITFAPSDHVPMQVPVAMRTMAMKAGAAMAMDAAESSAPMERSEKIVSSAIVVMAADIDSHAPTSLKPAEAKDKD